MRACSVSTHHGLHLYDHYHGGNYRSFLCQDQDEIHIKKGFRLIHSPNPVNLMNKKDAGFHADVLLATLEFARQACAKIVIYHARPCGLFSPIPIFMTISGAPSITGKNSRPISFHSAEAIPTCPWAGETFPSAPSWTSFCPAIPGFS